MLHFPIDDNVELREKDENTFVDLPGERGVFALVRNMRLLCFV